MLRGKGTAAVVLAGTAVAAAGCGGGGQTCVYGSQDTGSREALACKPRPAPTAAERDAVLSGAALRAGLAAWAKTGDAEADLLGVGLNAWGETTFTKQDDELVTFGPKGEDVPQDDPQERNYATAVGTASVKASQVRPAVLAKAIARVRRAAPKARFRLANYGSLQIAPGVGWRLSFTEMGPAGELVVVGDGPVCSLSQRGVPKGLAACDLRALLTGQGQAAPPGSAAPAAPTAPAIPPEAAERAKCVEQAGTDAAKLLECAQ